MKKFKKFFAPFLVMLLVILSAVPAFAAPEDTEIVTGTGIAGAVTEQRDDRHNNGGYDWGFDDPDNQFDAEDVSIDDAINWVDRKGDDVYRLVQKGAKVLSIILFVVGIVLTIAGAVGNRRLMVGGFITLAFCCLAYVGATRAKDIMFFVSAWLQS